MKFQALSFAIALVAAVASVASISTFSPARPPALPLAVKNPYLSIWLDAGSDGGGNGGYLAGQWATHWANKVTGWTGLIRVDNKTYVWMGAPLGGYPLVTQLSFEYTSTKSMFSMAVGDVLQMNITFFSPVTPTDMKRQSLGFSYLNVAVGPADGRPHDVQLYSDITAGEYAQIYLHDTAPFVFADVLQEWVSGNNTVDAEWEYGVEDGIAYHRVWAVNQLLFSETGDMADWGYWYYATNNVTGSTYQSGPDLTVRDGFVTTGALPNTNDTDFRAIEDYLVFGHAVNLSRITGPVETLFSVGLCQEQAVQFTGSNGTNSIPPLWQGYFSDDLEALSYFHNDYATASILCTEIDNQVASDTATAGGDNYTTIGSLALHQIFGAIQFCGTVYQPYLFLKEISSDGNAQTVDVIFPAHPVFLYTNPILLKYLLDPLFEYQESGKYPNKYSIHDLGANYPNATGHPDGKDEYMPLEECGNMLIMTLLYAQKAQDTDYLTQHYEILNQWTGYLVEEALYPANQISTDDFLGPLANSTNLALKGIIGISAMAQIAKLTDHARDKQVFRTLAQSYIQQWQQLATVPSSPPIPAHLSLTYHDPSPQSAWYSLAYNLYADSALNLNLVPQSVYDMQSAFYPTVAQPHGIPLDPRHPWTKSDWEMFAAAIASEETKALIVERLAEWVSETPTNRAMGDLFDSQTGDYVGADLEFVARPVMGGTFALLVIEGVQMGKWKVPGSRTAGSGGNGTAPAPVSNAAGISAASSSSPPSLRGYNQTRSLTKRLEY